MQWCRKVKKFWLASSKVWAESAPPLCGNRVKWSAKIWGVRGSPVPLVPATLDCIYLKVLYVYYYVQFLPGISPNMAAFGSECMIFHDFLLIKLGTFKSRSSPLKVSTFQKQSFFFSFPPNNKRNYYLISTLRIWNGWNLKCCCYFKYPLINMNKVPFLIQPVLEARAKIKKIIPFSFFWGNENKKICLWNLLTFTGHDWG